MKNVFKMKCSVNIYKCTQSFNMNEYKILDGDGCETIWKYMQDSREFVATKNILIDN